MQVTEYNVGHWCLSEDECIAQGIDFAAYERGVADAAKAFGLNRGAPDAAPVGEPARRIPAHELADWRRKAAPTGVAADESTRAADGRLFMDHGVWHDRVTGQHLYTQEQFDAEQREALALRSASEKALVGMQEAAKLLAEASTPSLALAHGIKAIRSALEPPADVCPKCLQPWDDHEWGVPSPYCPPAPPSGERPSAPAPEGEKRC